MTGSPGVVLVLVIVAVALGVMLLVVLLMGAVVPSWRGGDAERLPCVADARTFAETFEVAATGLLTGGHGASLSSLAALEDLADADPTRRQPVVATLCAYLRRATESCTEDGVGDAAVRRAAQQILTRHLAVTEGTCFWGAQDLYLDGAVLHDLDLRAAVVRTLSLRGARLHGDTTLTGARVEGAVDLTGADLAGALLAADVDVEQRLRCSGAHFAGPVTFRRAVVRGAATFTGAVFAGPADLSATMFRSTARLDARFDDDVDLARAVLTDARLEGIDVAGALDFTDTSFASRPPAAR